MAKQTILNNEVSVSDAFRAVAYRYGFQDVTVNFVPSTDLKVRWVRCGRTILVDVSDYLAQADPAVASGLADTIFKRIAEGSDSQYPEHVVSYLTSPKFVKANQNTYISRNQGLVADDGSLHDSYERLVKQGLVEKDPNLKLYYSKGLNKQASHSSMLFHTTQVNKKLKDIDDDEARDYAVYKALAPAQLEFDIPNRMEQAEEKISQFPNYEDVRARVYQTYGVMNVKPKDSLKNMLTRKVKP